MAYIGLFLIIIVNCIVLFFTSFLAAGNDGNADGVYTVWIIGYAWIAIFGFVSLRLCVRGRKSAAFVMAIGTLPIGLAAAQAIVIVFIIFRMMLGLN